MNDITTNVYYIELLACAGEVDTCYNDSLCYVGIYLQLLSIVPAAYNLPFMDLKYKFTKYFTLFRKRAEHFSMYSEMSNSIPTVILNSGTLQLAPCFKLKHSYTVYIIGASLSKTHTGGSRFNHGTVVTFPKVYATNTESPTLVVVNSTVVRWSHS